MVISDERPAISPSSFPYAYGLLHEFPSAVAAHLLREAKPVVLRKGDVLFRRGDPGDACFLVRHGLIKSSILSARGEESIVALHGAGAIMGEIAMIDGLPRVVTAQALGECRLDAIGRDAFRACMREQPEMCAGACCHSRRPAATGWRGHSLGEPAAGPGARGPRHAAHCPRGEL